MNSTGEKSGDKKAELTSTFKLSLRPIGDPVEELLANASTEERNIIAALDSKSAMLIALGGPGKGARFLINEDQTRVGRAPESEIFLDDVTVSRKHASIEKIGTNFTFKDSGSLNGSYVNNESVTEKVLTSGDEIQIGKFHLLFVSSKLVGEK